MADLPLEGRTEVVETKTEVPLTLEQRVDLMGKDIQELARGVNSQARLLEAVVLAANYVSDIYQKITRVQTTGEVKEESK